MGNVTLPLRDADLMTDYYCETNYCTADDSVLIKGPKPYSEEMPSENSCYTTVKAVRDRANTLATKLLLLDEKLSELAPMWDEIKVRSAHNVQEAIKWFLKEERRQQYIDKIKEIVNLFKDEQTGEDMLVNECVLGDFELANCMSPEFIVPVTKFLANMEQLSWEGMFQAFSCETSLFFAEN